ncbi:sensor domain-containing diguanylate cyclase [Reinekea blandensis]|nr:sensor domain-containing diguanylate cyclase [Reinekea blandensis]
MVKMSPITQQKRVRSSTIEQADEAARLMAAVFDASPDMLLVLNPDGFPVHCNKNSVQHFQCDKSELLNNHLSHLITSSDRPANSRQQILQIIKSGRAVQHLSWTAQRQNNSQFPVDVAFSPLPEGLTVNGQPAQTLVTMRDDTQRLTFEERITRLAHFDSITGLINRNLLEDRARQAIYRAKRLQGKMAFLFLDLDYFKQVNDHFGHLVGDRLLKAVGLRVQSILRDDDTMGRLGGDEFLILVERISYADDAMLIGEKIIHTLAEPFGIDGHRLQISGTIGIALYPDHGHAINTLLDHADKAMYRAKELGRNKLAVFNPAVC